MKDEGGKGIILPLEKFGIKLMSIGLLVDEKEISERKKSFKPVPHKYRRGVLAKYSKVVGSASKGAVCG